MSDAPHNQLDSKKVAAEEQLASPREENATSTHEQQVAYWESELLRARGEAVIDGRSDWAAERYALVLTAELPDERLRARAMDGLAELAETGEGRTARRVLIRHYRLLGDWESITQMKSLSLRIGTSNERIAVLKARVIGAVRRDGATEDPLKFALAGIDARRATPEELGRALLLAYDELQDVPDALSLIPLAIYQLRIAGSSTSILEYQLLYLELSDHPDEPTAKAYVTDVLSELGAQSPRGLLERALRNPKFVELRARSALLLDLQEQRAEVFSLPSETTDQRPRPVIADIELGTRSPLSGASDFAMIEFEVEPTAVEIDSEVTDERPRSSRFKQDMLPGLEDAAEAEPDQRDPLYTLAQAYRELHQPEQELQTLGRLASLLPQDTDGDELSHLYRRSSELLLELGDTGDALRIRIEGVFLSSLRGDDEQFILRHCDVSLLGDTLSVIRHLIEHAEDEREVHLSYVAAKLLLTINDDPDAAWQQLFSSWRRYPNDTPTAQLIIRLGADPRRAPQFHDAVSSLAADGAFRDPTLLKQLLSLSVRIGDDDCLITLHVNAAAVAPLDVKARRNLENVLQSRGRSRASGFQQVLLLVNDIEARDIWTSLCAGALEAEQRFSEASDQLLELYMRAPNDDEPLDRALLNLEHERQWPRIIRIIEEELTSLRSARSTVARLRYLSRIERLSGTNERVALNAAVRTALRFPKEHVLDVHARVELAVYGDLNKLASYVEDRAQLLGRTPEGAELFREAASLVASLPDPDPERMQRLWATARRAGVELRERGHRPVQRLTTFGPHSVSSNVSFRDRQSGSKESPSDVIPVSDHSVEGFWRSIVESPAAQRAKRLGNFLDVETLNALSVIELDRPNRSLVRLTAKELTPWLHGKPTDGSQHDDVRLYNSWSIPSLDADIQSYLDRIGAQTPLSSELQAVLGDPIDALRVHARSDVAPLANGSDSICEPVLIGFNSAHWLTKYSSDRLPALFEIVDQSDTPDKDSLKEKLAVIPWILAIYGSGSIISSYRSLMVDLGLPRALNHQELVEQMEAHPRVAMLFAEWAYLSQR